MQCISKHEWVIAPFRADRDAARNGSAPWLNIDAHHNHRGPYTAASALIRTVVEQVSAGSPTLIKAHQLTLLLVAPEIQSWFPVRDEVAKWLAVSREGDPRSWTLRLAHGIADFLLSHVAHAAASRFLLSFENVDLADPLDCEFMAVLLRRADPEQLLIRIGSSCECLDASLLSALQTYAVTKRLEPGAHCTAAAVPRAWQAWLRECAAGWLGEWLALTDLSKYLDLATINPPQFTLDEFLTATANRLPLADRRAIAVEYVESNCTSDRLLAKHAYAALPDRERKALHLARAAALGALNQESLKLGAIPFHQEQASADTTPLLAASNRCMHLTYYEASLDWARRGRLMLGPDRGEHYSAFARNILFSLVLLGRYGEVEEVCTENLALSNDPALLARTAYAKAILNASLYDPSRRDYQAARVWAEKALAFVQMLPYSPANAVHIAFLRNTLALVELRMGRPAVALQLLAEALEYLTREAPGENRAERAILLHNHARLHAAMNQPVEAIANLTALLECQPGDSAAYFDRAVLYQRLARHEEALRDYNAAIEWSPPYPEAYLNRAQCLISLGRQAEALADYDRVLELAPNHVAALISRACLSFHQGHFQCSRTDVEAGLRLRPTNARLLCLRGLLEIEDGQLDQAHQSFTKAIEADPSLPDAWANRATVRFKHGDLEGATTDLTQALSLREDANALYNRGRVFEAQRKWTHATQDYSRALDLAGENRPDIERHRDLCHRASRQL